MLGIRRLRYRGVEQHEDVAEVEKATAAVVEPDTNVEVMNSNNL